MPAPILPGVTAEGGTPSRSWSFTSENTSLTETRQFVGVPGNLIGMVHPDYAYLWLDSVQASEVSTGVYNAQLSWNSRSVHRNTAGVYRPVITPGTWMMPVVVTRDMETGVPVLNTAGDNFDTALERQIAQPMRSITVRRSSYPDADEAFIGFCNSAPFTIAGVTYPKYCACLEAIDPGEEKTDPDTGDPYYVCTYRFKLSTYEVDGVRIGFRSEVLNQGYKDFNGVAFVGDDNIALEKPTLLDVDGFQTSTPLFLRFVNIPLKNFATLSLPSGR